MYPLLLLFDHLCLCCHIWWDRLPDGAVSFATPWSARPIRPVVRCWRRMIRAAIGHGSTGATISIFHRAGGWRSSASPTMLDWL